MKILDYTQVLTKLGLRTLFGLSVLGMSANATQVYVREFGVTPFQMVSVDMPGFYSGPLRAGIIKLGVGPAPDQLSLMDGFCIDPLHFSVRSTLLYDVVELKDGPKPPGPMGPGKAQDISKLWEMAYAPDMSASSAAALQIAIWEIVGGDDFAVVGEDFGASALLAALPTYVGAGADLIALSGEGQDYVIPTDSVPESGATITLFALALFGLIAGMKLRDIKRWQRGDEQ
ncbi:MAG: hypothetical protein ACR2OZ_20150 [Verrucomicrobiales bacterium]